MEQGRNTIQKQIVLDTLKSINSHPSVDELYSLIKEKHPSISKATVYRNVHKLAETGEILQVNIANDVSRYDGCTNPHHHFVCKSCSKIFDIHLDEDDNSDKIKNLVSNKYGFKLDKCVTSLFGVCSICVVK